MASFFADIVPAAVGPASVRRRHWNRLVRRETVDLIRFYYAIPDAEVREKYLALVRAIASAPPVNLANRSRKSRTTER